MSRLFSVVWLCMYCLPCILQGQVGSLRHWKEVRDLRASQINRQIPVYIEGTVVFSDKPQSFFVVGDGVEGVPVHVLDAFPDLETGDRVRITGTTMRLLQQPGVRMVTLEKSIPHDHDPEIIKPPDAFQISDPYFKTVHLEGLITSVAKVKGELLLGISRIGFESYYLRIPDRIWKRIPTRRVVGRWVKATGLYFPPDRRRTGLADKSSFVISSINDLQPIQDLVHTPATTLNRLSELSALNPSKPVIVEGNLEWSDKNGWVVKKGGVSIALDWVGDEVLSGAVVRCIGFPAKRSEQLALTSSILFAQETSNSTERFVWKPPVSSSVLPLSNIADVHALDLKRAKQNIPVDLDVIVTYHQPSWSLLFVEDPTGSIFVTPSEPFPEWMPGGTKLHLKGNVIAGHSLHSLHQATYEVVGHDGFPRAEVCDFDDMLSGEFDCRYVEITGRVRRILRIGNVLELKIQAESGSFTAFIRDSQAIKDPSELLDSTITLTGVCGMEWENNKAVGFVLYVEDASHLQVIHARPDDAQPALQDSINQQQLAGKSFDEIRQVRLSGFLTAQVGEAQFAFQTASQGFLIEPQSVDEMASIGESIELTGWPRLDGGGVFIEDVVISAVKAPSRLVPLEKDSAPILNRDLLYRLISRQGILEDVHADPHQITFMFQSPSERFAAKVNVKDVPEFSSSTIELGSLMRVCGVLNSVPSDPSSGEVPSLVLRSKGDLKMLAPPPWWTPQRILTAMGITGFVGMMAMLWGVALKRRVTQQTEHIRQMLIKDRQSEEKYHNLFESALDLIFITDTQGRFVAANESCLNFFGMNLEEIQGESFLGWIANEDEQKAKRAFGLIEGEQSRTALEGVVVEVAMRNRNGRFAHVELSVRGLALQDGVFGYQAIARNVEARIQSEQELIHSRDSHREANEAKTDFLTMISHDLRTPMNGVLGMTQLLLQSNLEKEQKDQVRTISAASGSVLKLMLDMIEMSQMETGQLTFVDESVDLIAVVEEVVNTLVAEVDLKHLDLVVICQPDFFRHVRTDRARLKQVLLNLVSNAIKFTDKGGVAIRLIHRGQQDGNQVVRFEIEDSGIPLQKGNRENLFEALTKPGENEPRRFGGAGLGLTLCKRIVMAMGGGIGVEESSNEGVLLWFELPLAGSESPGKQPPIKNEINKIFKPVLLVSDSRFIIEYFVERAKQIHLPVDVLSVPEFKEQLMNGKPWDRNPFQTLLVDCRDLPFDLLTSMIDQADAFWKSHIQWVLIDTLHHLQGSLSRLPIDSKPLRVMHPLTDASFDQFCYFLLKKNETDHAPDNPLNKIRDISTSKEILNQARLRVLVAEDDPTNQKLIRMYLKKNGCITKIVPEGGQAIQRLESDPFDVVLMDCNMAGIDGIEATRRIRSDSRFDDLVIIATTANALKGHREKCIDAGMNDFMVKPLNLQVLTMKLARIATQRYQQNKQ